jgi:hypothetical protein
MRSLFLRALLGPDFHALLPVAVEAIKKLSIVAAGRGELINHHHIETDERCLMVSK